MKIDKKLTSINHTARRRGKDDIKFIVVHYVGALGGARDNASYYASTYVGASADFYVGHQGEIWQGNDYWNFYSWHCGGGYQSSWTKDGGGKYYGVCTNKNSIGIELCVHKRSTRTMNATDADWYFEDATVKAGAQLVASLMKELNIDIAHVIRHYDVNRKICPNPFVVDYQKWLDFKKLVASYAGGTAEPEIVITTQYYRVGLDWKDGKCIGQLGAYEIPANAKASCPSGYKVFDPDGKVYYEAPKAVGTQSSEFSGLPEAECAKKILEIAKAEGVRAHILPSLIAAQAILESGYCKTTELVQKANNCFGMKCSLSNNGWASVWDGVSKVNIRTPEEYTPGVITYIYADFRKYPNIEKSFEDHSCYLLGAMNGNRKRYAGLTECKKYKDAITLVKNGGYATDTKYISKLCNIVERYGLDKYDALVAGTPATTTQKTAEEKSPTTTTPQAQAQDRYAVRKSLADTASQLGLFHVLDNAKKLADAHYGYEVYDITTGKAVYIPNTTKRQTFIAELKEMNRIVKGDIEAGHQWKYCNSSKKKSKGFDQARKEGKYLINCVDGVQWALKRAGLVGSDGLSWYGGHGGPVWLNSNAEKNAKKYFQLIPVKTKTVSQCVADGTLQPGDVITYMGMSHTNAYLGNNKSFDTGHAYCTGSGEGAPFKKWIGNLACKGYKIAYILRLKENGKKTEPTPTPAPQPTGTYRVQVGAYQKQAYADKLMKRLEDAEYDTFYEKINSIIYVYAGSFSDKARAEARKTELWKKLGIKAIIK